MFISIWQRIKFYHQNLQLQGEALKKADRRNHTAKPWKHLKTLFIQTKNHWYVYRIGWSWSREKWVLQGDDDLKLALLWGMGKHSLNEFGFCAAQGLPCFFCFSGQSFLRCLTEPHSRQQPPFGYSPLSFCGQSLEMWPTSLHMKHVAYG